MQIRVCRYKNVGVAGYAEAFMPVPSDSQTSEWYSYFENAVLVFIKEKTWKQYDQSPDGKQQVDKDVSQGMPSGGSML